MATIVRTVRPILFSTRLQRGQQVCGTHRVNYCTSSGKDTGAKPKTEKVVKAAAKPEPPKEVKQVKPETVKAVKAEPVKPKEEFRNDQYDSKDYYGYNKWSFYDIESAMIPHRVKQPSPYQKY
ncbi:uncharacterized protein LOC144441406 [Glandiceps talaboti]